MDWPDWWEWELELSPHVFKRMDDRSFTELHLRAMLEIATGYEADVVSGRWRIITRRNRKRWEVIVEPDELQLKLVVVTAYPVYPAKS